MDSVDVLFANTRNNPIKDIESHVPLRIERHELSESVAAAGKWRGGLGSIRTEHDPTDLADDILDEYITIEQARRLRRGPLGRHDRRRGSDRPRAPNAARDVAARHGIGALHMSRLVNVAGAQLGPISGNESREHVVGRLLELMREAKGRGADLVV